MKPILEYLFSKKSDLDKLKTNRFGITKNDMIGEIEGFPVGILVRMLEETENRRNKPDIKVFQRKCAAGDDDGGFDWHYSKKGKEWWWEVIKEKNFDLFYKEYPEYKKYDI